MPLLIDLFLTFVKIGVVSFGGGYGMISLLTQEVLEHGWLTYEQLLNFIAVSESTPGPIAINMATFIGYSQAGFLGALLATIGVVLPAFLIILVIVSILKNLLKFAGVQAFLNGVRPVVVGLIVGTGITIFISVVFGISKIGDSFVFDWKSLTIFCLTGVLYFVYKILRKKSISAILLIIFAALLGLLFYGVF
ncbi:MAG: chromate transporter [Clostridia bacterium]|nr:chromate transporter [Clostridia bacterium]